MCAHLVGLWKDLCGLFAAGRPAAAPSRRPSLEGLEQRCVPATARLLADGTLSILGTQGNDVINVRQVGAVLYVNNLAFAVSRVSGIAINAQGGNDVIDLRPRLGQLPITLPTTIHGGAGDDTIFGG